jgi:hypothetical protein
VNTPSGAQKARLPPPSVTGASGCFFARQAQGFRVLDRSNLIVFAPNESHAYHVRISPPSTDLRFAESLAFLPADAWICGHAGERLVIGGARRELPLAVLDVSRLSAASLAALGGDGASRTVPATSPQPGPGPAIEGAPGGQPAPEGDGSPGP